jgi:beta-lactamase superfamily II metal-dependent hydrolase
MRGGDVPRRPTKLTIRAYQVGFGDCFLLTWGYPSGDKHILIDFGSSAAPKSLSGGLLERVARDIAKQSGGHLDAVVVTNRHKDHVDGFRTDGPGTAPGKIIRSLNPDLVVQPWTEDPRAKKDAEKAAADIMKSQKARVGAREAFVASLESMGLVAGGVVGEARRLQASEPVNFHKHFFANLAFAGEEGIENRSAVENLRTMGKRHAYVSHGSQSGLESMLPGVRVTVLGPPTLKQADSIRKDRTVDRAEFWMMKGLAGRRLAAGANTLFPRAQKHTGKVLPEYARWFAPKLRQIRASALQGIVRVVDDAMSNTSVILLFEAGGKAFLFAGDAQIENWEYTLEQPSLMRRLAKVDFYKVGHHGSGNATPKSLWANFSKRGSPKKTPRLRTVVSTMADKYGRSAGAEVPRKTLVEALKKESDFYSTQTLKSRKKLFEPFVYNL